MLQAQKKDERDEDSTKSSNEAQKTVERTVVWNARNRRAMEKEQSFLERNFCSVTLLRVKCENELTLHPLYSKGKPVDYRS